VILTTCAGAYHTDYAADPAVGHLCEHRPP